MAGVRVLIADDHQVVRDGLRAMLTSTGAAEAGTGQQAVRETTLHHSDVVVMDLAMPGLTELRRPARPYAPTRRLGCWCRPCTTTMTRVFAAMRAGARGYVLKGASQQELAQPFPELNTREQEDLGLIAKGLNNAAIGQRLLLAPRQSATSLGLLLERCATVFAAWCEAKPQVNAGM